MNIFLALLALRPIGHQPGRDEATTRKRNYESQKHLLDKIDLIGLGDWNQNEKEAWELITEYTSIFAMSNMHLGKTSLAKHIIWLIVSTLFKKHY